MHETMIKRTLWIGKCGGCGEKYEWDRDPPKEKLCKCGEWVVPEEKSFTSSEYKGAPKHGGH